MKKGPLASEWMLVEHFQECQDEGEAVVVLAVVGGLTPVQ